MPKNAQTTAQLHSCPTPVVSPGKSHGRRSLVGYSPWGRKELDMTEKLHFTSLGLEGKLTFSSPAATAEFSKFAGILSAILSQHHLLAFEVAQRLLSYAMLMLAGIGGRRRRG